MANKYYSRLGTDYSRRYKSRNQRKLNYICEHLQDESVRNVLDIGCNQGYVIKSLLDRNIIEFGYGVDLDKRIINTELLRDERFTFYEKDIIEFTFPKIFDVIVYNSVHQHIFANYGGDVAFKVWQAIINNCNQLIFFETSVLTEQGPVLSWKNELRIKYKDDNHMISDIFTKIGPRLKNIEIIGSSKIHSSKKSLYKISLFPLPDNNDFSIYVKNLYSGLLTKDSLWSVEKEMLRRSSHPPDIRLALPGHQNTRRINEDVRFFILKKKDEDKKYFGKRYTKDVFRQIREFTINQKTNHPRILKTCFANEKYGLISEYIPWYKISEIVFNKINTKKKPAIQIKEFFRYFKRKKIEYSNMIDPIANITNRKHLCEIIDLNINNFLVQIENGEIVDWKAIDFDFSLVNTKTRNKINYLSIINTINRNSRYAFIYNFRIRFYKTLLYYSRQISLKLFSFNISNLNTLFRKRMISIKRIIAEYFIKPFSK